MEKDQEKRCELAECNAVLVRGAEELQWNWEKRRHCDKVCAGFASSRRRRAVVPSSVRKEAVTVISQREVLPAGEEEIARRMLKGALK